MNAAARQPADAAHRARVLRALGVTPWQRRGAPAVAVAQAAQAAQADAPAAAAAAGVACVAGLPQGCSAREVDRISR